MASWRALLITLTLWGGISPKAQSGPKKLLAPAIDTKNVAPFKYSPVSYQGQQFLHHLMVKNKNSIKRSKKVLSSSTYSNWNMVTTFLKGNRFKVVIKDITFTQDISGRFAKKVKKQKNVFKIDNCLEKYPLEVLDGGNFVSGIEALRQNCIYKIKKKSLKQWALSFFTHIHIQKVFKKAFGQWTDELGPGETKVRTMREGKVSFKESREFKGWAKKNDKDMAYFVSKPTNPIKVVSKSILGKTTATQNYSTQIYVNPKNGSNYLSFAMKSHSKNEKNGAKQGESLEDTIINARMMAL